MEKMPLLRLEHLQKRFGGLVAVEDFEMAMEEEEIVGLIGPNGAGKTTVFNIMAGFHRPDAGRVLFQGEDLVGRKPHQICALGVARTFQVTKPFGDLSVLENVMVGAFARIKKAREARHRALEVLEWVGFSDRKEVLGHELTTVDHKRLELARALATRPRLLLLDEPMAGLNPTEKLHLLDLFRDIRKGGVTLFVVEHDMKAVMNLCERIVVMDRGKKLLEGTPEQVAHDPRAISAYLGEEYGTA
ncbi:MAG: ABC transporter ATP-binding protein [candidate division NC10 bacterium]|nr:ABC transporter ATP-binding protein [candidate division NC10 bacterium]